MSFQVNYQPRATNKKTSVEFLDPERLLRSNRREGDKNGAFEREIKMERLDERSKKRLRFIY